MAPGQGANLGKSFCSCILYYNGMLSVFIRIASMKRF